jgi:hypothetical protein
MRSFVWPNPGDGFVHSEEGGHKEWSSPLWEVRNDCERGGGLYLENVLLLMAGA